MQHCDAERFRKILTIVAENFSATISTGLITLFFSRMSAQGITIEQFEEAALRIVDGRVYTKMPTIGEFITCIKGDPEERAQIQAMEVLSAVRQHGAWETVCFEDQVTNAVVRAKFGGWPRLCELNDSEYHFFTKSFVGAYTALLRAGAKYDGPLLGLHAVQDGKNGTAVERDVHIIGTSHIGYINTNTSDGIKNLTKSIGAID